MRSKISGASERPTVRAKAKKPASKLGGVARSRPKADKADKADKTDIADKTKKADKAGPRRIPSQARSKERVGRILDAAEHELAEHGYEGATTEAIALRAGASIGSLYQFFPNKRALFDAIAERYLGGVETFFGDLIANGATSQSWADLIDTMIDAFWRVARESKAFRAVWLNGHFSEELLHASDALNRTLEARAETVLEMVAPDLSAEKRRAIATLLIEVTGIVLFVAARKREPLASSLIEESKLLMRSYVGVYAGPLPKKKSRH